MKYLSAFVLLTALAAPAAAQSQTTFRNDKGQTTGTATTDSNGTTTFRNEKGQTTGTATTNSSGTTIFRNSLGQTTGTAKQARLHFSFSSQGSNARGGLGYGSVRNGPSHIEADLVVLCLRGVE